MRRLSALNSRCGITEPWCQGGGRSSPVEANGEMQEAGAQEQRRRRMGHQHWPIHAKPGSWHDALKAAAQSKLQHDAGMHEKLSYGAITHASTFGACKLVYARVKL